MSVDTRIMTERPHAPGRHQRKGQRPDYRAYANGTPWGSEGYGGGGSAPAAPTLTSLVPNTAAAGSGQLYVRCNGTGFAVPTAVAKIDGVATSTAVIDAVSLSATYVPTVAGTYQFSVVNPDGQETGTLPFTVT